MERGFSTRPRTEEAVLRPRGARRREEDLGGHGELVAAADLLLRGLGVRTTHGGCIALIACNPLWCIVVPPPRDPVSVRARTARDAPREGKNRADTFLSSRPTVQVSTRDKEERGRRIPDGGPDAKAGSSGEQRRAWLSARSGVSRGRDRSASSAVGATCSCSSLTALTASMISSPDSMA